MATAKSTNDFGTWYQGWQEAQQLKAKIPTSYYTGATSGAPTGASEAQYRSARSQYDRAIGRLGTMPTPTQEVPQYQAGAVSSFINQYLSSVGNINVGSYDFSTSPIGFSPITAQTVNAEQAVQRAFQYNQGMMQEYGAMAQQMTDIDVQNKERQLDEFVPGWRQSTDKVRAINESYMRGEIPKDVADNLTRSAAFVTAMGGGSAQGQAALTARDLGLTSMQLQQQGMAGTQSYMQMMNQLMPEMTTAASVMGSQGMNAQMAVTTALQNAELKLRGDVATSQGQLQAATATQELGLRGAEAASRVGMEQARIQADAAARAAEMQTSNIVNQYYANLEASKIRYGNIERPFLLQLAKGGFGL
jgi:hypothetical protein